MRTLVLLVVSAVALRAGDAATTPEAALVAGVTEKFREAGQYKGLRSLYAAYAERKYADEIERGLGADAAKLREFLKANAEFRETLLCALNPEADKIPAVYTVLSKLYEAEPEKLKAFPQLAIAVCVTWDDPDAVYDYRFHATRTQAKLPSDLMKYGPVENFRNLVSRDASITAVLQSLPWEFLVHVVNHRTPDVERDWAVKEYGKRRPMIGKVYPTIKYDDEMLRTEMANGPGKGVCKIGGHDYTLANLRQYGGVCAHQADFSARVAKSLAIPAEYVRGEGNSGGLHAWVMWVEIKSVTKDKIDFALLSEGRYFGDQYYVGTLEDPHSGKDMSDRDLERRLTAIGTNPQNSRQADLLMRAYPMIRQEKSLTPKQCFAWVRTGGGPEVRKGLAGDRRIVQGPQGDRARGFRQQCQQSVHHLR
jgi:hypothetical protein